MAESDALFYNLSKVEEVAVNLFYGWGYNFYRIENQLRADDLMIRSRIEMIFGLVRSKLETIQGTYRRKFLPSPTREKPRPDPECLENARTIEHLCSLVGALKGRVNTLPVPETDRMTQRYRQEAATLATLATYDSQLVGRSEILNNMLQGKDHEWLFANEGDIVACLALLSDSLDNRQRLLQ